MAEINNEYSNSEIINYQVSGAEKKLYHSSKEPKEGYRKIEMKEGGFTYHRYLDGLIGKLSYLNFKDTSFGKRFGILLKDGGETASISVTLDNEPYRVFIEALYNVDFNKEIAVKFYPKTAVTQKGEKKTYQNCFLYYPQEFFTDGDGKKKNVCPERLDSKKAPQGKQRASGKWDFSEQEEWYYEKAAELVARFEKWKLSKSTESVKEEKPVPKQGVEVTEDQELPY
jgi:hypothetical protein